MRKSALVILIVMFCFTSVYANGSKKEISRRFDRKESVEIKLVSGDCTVRTHDSSEIRVDIIYQDDLEDRVEFNFRERGGTLYMEEDWNHSGSGDIHWIITLPGETDVDFSSASGDLQVSGLSGNLEGRTASGDIVLEGIRGSVDVAVASGDVEIRKCKGEIEISSASGDIFMENCSGEIELSTASGDIEAVGIDSKEIELHAASGDIDISESRGAFEISVASGEVKAEEIKITGKSEFSTASGEVEIILAESPEHNLDLSTASGDILLDYNGNPVKGNFEFTAKKHGGHIKAPFDFDREEEFEKNGKEYLRKSFRRKNDSPFIYLSTASGSVELRK